MEFNRRQRLGYWALIGIKCTPKSLKALDASNEAVSYLLWLKMAVDQGIKNY
jgi:hypothetical protein